MSRRLLPKQFLPLVSNRTLLQDTVLRVRGFDGARAPIVVSNDEHRFLVAEQMREIGVKPEIQILRSEEHTSELQSPCNLVCRLLLEKKNRARRRSLQFDITATKADTNSPIRILTGSRGGAT